MEFYLKAGQHNIPGEELKAIRVRFGTINCHFYLRISFKGRSGLAREKKLCLTFTGPN